MKIPALALSITCLLPSMGLAQTLTCTRSQFHEIKSVDGVINPTITVNGNKVTIGKDTYTINKGGSTSINKEIGYQFSKYANNGDANISGNTYGGKLTLSTNKKKKSATVVITINHVGKITQQKWGYSQPDHSISDMYNCS